MEEVDTNEHYRPKSPVGIIDVTLKQVIWTMLILFFLYTSEFFCTYLCPLKSLRHCFNRDTALWLNRACTVVMLAIGVYTKLTEAVVTPQHRLSDPLLIHLGTVILPSFICYIIFRQNIDLCPTLEHGKSLLPMFRQCKLLFWLFCAAEDGSNCRFARSCSHDYDPPQPSYPAFLFYTASQGCGLPTKSGESITQFLSY